MTKRRRTWRFKLVVMTMAAFASLGLAELLLGLLGIGFPRPYVADEFIGTRLQPGFHAWFGKEGGAYVKVNDQGFRDTQHASQKSPQEFRIAVLGDSYVEAAQVSLQQTFWKQLETQLNLVSEQAHITCMGFGVSGFGTAQQLLTFCHYAKAMQPDVVILAMTLGNDIRNNSRELEPVQERPFFRIDTDHHGGGVQLVEDRSFLQHPAFLQAQRSETKFKTSVINASRLLQVLTEFKNRPSTAPPMPLAEQGQEHSIYKPPEDEQWKLAWKITEALVLQLNREVTAADSRLVVVTLTDGMQVHPEQATYEDFCRKVGVKDLGYSDNRIAELCHAHNIPVLNLADSMRLQAVSDHVYFHGFSNTKLGTGHWNVAGHLVAGDLIADFLRQHELVPAATSSQ